MNVCKITTNIGHRGFGELTRVFDLLLSALGLLVFSPILLVIFLAVRFETHSPFFIQDRLGRNLEPFKLYKFRTMSIDTASLPSHLVNRAAVTKLGRFLRQNKLDELPQLWNVFKGDMSLVGPRPNLLSQVDLIEKRKAAGIFKVKPGITGLAQIKKVDMSQPCLLVQLDAQMIRRFTLAKYFYYIYRTMLGAGSGDQTNE